MEIKVGEYVRLKKGEIFKIDENTTNYYNSNKEYVTNEIVKHSKPKIILIIILKIIMKEMRMKTQEVTLIQIKKKWKIIMK